jgi:hypothetical protein
MGDAVTLKAALDGVRARLEALDDSKLKVTAGLDPTEAANKVIGNLERILRFRPAIAAQFEEEGTAIVDALEVAALATQQADIELAAAERAADLTAMHEILSRHHKRLVADATPLAERDLLDATAVDKAKSTQGYDTTLKNTLVLVALFRAAFPAIEGKTLMTLAELDAIEKHAQAIGVLSGQRNQGTSALSASTLRTRSLSELVRTYGETRRMLNFIRWWEDDLDEIAPSLWAGRGRKTNRGTTEASPTDVGPTDGANEPDVPVPTPGPTDGPGPFTE